MYLSQEFLRWVLVLAGGLLFGFIWNWLTVKMNKTVKNHGYAAFLVVGGVAGTMMLATVLVGLEAALKVVAVFCATGTFMIIGSVRRHLDEEKEKEEATWKPPKEILDDDSEALTG